MAEKGIKIIIILEKNQEDKNLKDHVNLLHVSASVKLGKIRKWALPFF